MKQLKRFFAAIIIIECFFCTDNSQAQYVPFTGTNSVVIGTGSSFTNSYNSSFIAGKSSTVGSNYSAIIGSNSTNNGMYSYLIGYYSTINTNSSYVLGEYCKITNTYSMLLGYNLKTGTGNSFAIGYGNLGENNELTTTVPYSLIIGFKSKFPTFFVSPTPPGQSSGKIGIGNVTDPLSKLHIKADVTEDAGLLLEAPGTNKAAVLILNGTKNYISSPNKISPLAFLTGGENTRMVITGETGKIGIGNFSATEPEGKVHIKANENEDATLIIEASATSKVSGIVFKNSAGNIATLDALQPINFYTGSTTLRMKIDPHGNVGIGTDTPTKLLTVQGSSQFNGDVYVMASNIYTDGEIHAKKFRAVLDPLPDYVFSHDYKLRSLSEVKSFIGANNHLPDVPSAQEANLNGIELGEFNCILLKKIEELTLYILEQEERIKQLENSNISR